MGSFPLRQRPMYFGMSRRGTDAPMKLPRSVRSLPTIISGESGIVAVGFESGPARGGRCECLEHDRRVRGRFDRDIDAENPECLVDLRGRFAGVRVDRQRSAEFAR